MELYMNETNWNRTGCLFVSNYLTFHPHTGNLGERVPQGLATNERCDHPGQGSPGCVQSSLFNHHKPLMCFKVSRSHVRANSTQEAPYPGVLIVTMLYSGMSHYM
eukprot:1142120-Pelagomonas_calceolata.AAC.5